MLKLTLNVLLNVQSNDLEPNSHCRLNRINERIFVGIPVKRERERERENKFLNIILNY